MIIQLTYIDKCSLGLDLGQPPPPLKMTKPNGNGRLLNKRDVKKRRGNVRNARQRLGYVKNVNENNVLRLNAGPKPRLRPQKRSVNEKNRKRKRRRGAVYTRNKRKRLENVLRASLARMCSSDSPTGHGYLLYRVSNSDVFSMIVLLHPEADRKTAVRRPYPRPAMPRASRVRLQMANHVSFTYTLRTTFHILPSE